MDVLQKFFDISKLPHAEAASLFFVCAEYFSLFWPTIISKSSETEWLLTIRRLISILLILCMFASASAETFDSMIRLHVIADNDSPTAQAFKLEIRDAVLACAQNLLASCRDASEAWDVLNAHLSDFLAAASERAAQLGFEDKLSVQSGVFEFPDRVYGDIVVPAGEYRALRVIIGDGEGRNWWCVLYPNLCLPSEDGYRSILLDWLSRLFGGDRA